MKCPKCGAGPMVPGKDVLKRDFGVTLEEVVDVEQCPAGCGECIISTGVIEDAENRIAQTLVSLRVRNPRAIRFMLRGVYVDEIPLRFPQLTNDDVKGWRKNEGEVPEEVIEWAYKIAPTGVVQDCLCGHCLTPKPQLQASPSP